MCGLSCDKMDRDNGVDYDRRSERNRRKRASSRLVRGKKWIGPRSIGFSEWFGQCRSKWHPRPMRERSSLPRERRRAHWPRRVSEFTVSARSRVPVSRFVNCTRGLVPYHTESTKPCKSAAQTSARRTGEN